MPSTSLTVKDPSLFSLADTDPASFKSLAFVNELRADVATEVWELPAATLAAGVLAALLRLMLRLLYTAKLAG